MKHVLLLLVLLAAPALAADYTATITFEAPTQYTDNTAIPDSVVMSYDVFQGFKGETKVKVGTINDTNHVIDSGLTAGEICWDVVAIAAVTNSQPSEHSSEACKVFVADPLKPKTVTITVI